MGDNLEVSLGLIQDFITDNAEETNLLSLSEKLLKFFKDKMYIYPKEGFVGLYGGNIEVFDEAYLAVQLLSMNAYDIQKLYLEEFNEFLSDMGCCPRPIGMIDNEKFNWLKENYERITLEQLEEL